MQQVQAAGLNVPCPTCDTMLSIDYTIAGRGVRCDVCRDVLHVPYLVAKRVFSDAEAIPAIIESPDIAG